MKIAQEQRPHIRKINEHCYEIDVRGLVCPYPQLLVMRVLANLSSDDILEVLVDNPPSARDIPKAVGDSGHRVLDTSRSDASAWRIVIQTERQ